MDIKGLLQIWKAIHLRWNLCICNGVLSIKDGAVGIFVIFYCEFGENQIVPLRRFTSLFVNRGAGVGTPRSEHSGRTLGRDEPGTKAYMVWITFSLFVQYRTTECGKLKGYSITATDI